MKQRLSKVEASQELGVSISTIDRMIRRGNLQIEREGTKSNDRVWVILEGEEAAEAGDGHLPQQVAPQLLGQMMGMRRSCGAGEGAAGAGEESTRAGDYRGELLKEGELRFHALLQEFSQQPPDHRGPNAGAA